MSYVRMAQDYIEGSAERDLNALLKGWEERHGPIIQKHRQTRLQEGKDRRGYKTSRLVETVDVSFERKAARLVRVDQGPWRVERDPDTKPAPVDPDDPMVNSPAILNQCPNLKAPLRGITDDGE